MNSKNIPLAPVVDKAPQLELPQKFYGGSVKSPTNKFSSRLSIVTFLLALISGASKLWFPSAFLVLLFLTVICFLLLILYRMYRGNQNLVNTKNGRLAYADEDLSRWVETKYDLDMNQDQRLLLLNGQIATVMFNNEAIRVALKIEPVDFFLEKIADDEEFYQNADNKRFSLDDFTSGGTGYFTEDETEQST